MIYVIVLDTKFYSCTNSKQRILRILQSFISKVCIKIRKILIILYDAIKTYLGLNNIPSDWDIQFFIKYCKVFKHGTFVLGEIQTSDKQIYLNTLILALNTRI